MTEAGSGEVTLSFAPYPPCHSHDRRGEPGQRAIRESTSISGLSSGGGTVRKASRNAAGHAAGAGPRSRSGRLHWSSQYRLSSRGAAGFRRPKVAATNKCLARSNKPRTGVPATNKRPAARRNSSRRCQLARPVAGSALPVFRNPQRDARLARRSSNVLRGHYRRGRIPSRPLRRTPSREAGTSSVAEEALEKSCHRPRRAASPSHGC